MTDKISLGCEISCSATRPICNDFHELIIDDKV